MSIRPDSNRHGDNNFDGVRLAAALCVLATHQCLMSGLPEPRVLGTLTLGGAAVLVFFAISGYLVASSWSADPEAWRFAARRFLRIWPAYAVVVVGAAAWIIAIDERPLANTAAWMFMFKHLTFHSFEWNFFPRMHDPRLDPPIWTIPFEVGCYIAFALVGVVLRKWWAGFLAVAFVLALPAWAFGKAVFDPSAASLETDAALFGVFFAAGALLNGLPALRTAKVAAALVASGAAAFVAGSQLLGLALVVPTLAVAVGTRTWPVLSRAGRYGDFSYGIYLWGWPIQQVVASRLGPQAGVWRLTAVSCLLVGLLAVLSWHLVEKRALRLKPGSRTPWPRILTLVLR